MRWNLALVSVFALVTCLPFLAPPASAWEFELGTTFAWTYEWYDQLGARGFFGPYDRDAGTFTRAANLNFWNGGRFDTHITTSADSGWSFFTVDFLPTMKVNEAVKFSGKYHLGSYGDPTASDYHTQDAPGLNRAFSDGQWTMFWVTAQLPWGVFGIGKRPWVFGNALQYDGEDAATTESLAFVAPYGPWDIGMAFYPYRFAGSSRIPAFTLEDPYNLPFYFTAAGFPQQGQYFSRADKGGTFSKDFLAFAVYRNGPFEAGVLGSYGSYHIGSEALLIDPLDPPTSTLVPQDSDLFHGTGFFRYNNGRFFVNAEAAWLYWTDRYSNANAVVGPPNPRYVEQWRYMAEVGVLAGPAKFTLLTAWLPGPDRRAGTLIGKQPAAFVWHSNYDRQLGNYDVFRPYSCIFSYDYGSGLNAFNLNGDGYVRDAFVLAARLDYAVAANLNIFGAFFYANRTSNGYSWACLGPNAGVPGSGFINIPDGNVSFIINRYPASPNIPDTALGYEIDAGLDWKLLEGWTAGVFVGYWQPGKWFSYACVDRSVTGWEFGNAANFFGTRPDRSIDPVLGGQFYSSFSF